MEIRVREAERAIERLKEDRRELAMRLERIRLRRPESTLYPFETPLLLQLLSST